MLITGVIQNATAEPLHLWLQKFEVGDFSVIDVENII